MDFLTVFLLLVNLVSVHGRLGGSDLKLDLDLARRSGWNASNSSLTCLFLTSEKNWMGEQQNLCEAAGICAASLPRGLSANVSSAGPTDGQTCFLYSNVNCTGNRSAPIANPGYADLSTISFNEKAMSWRCWKMCGYKREASSSARSSLMPASVMPASSSSASASSPAFSFDPVTPSITSTLSGSQGVATAVERAEPSTTTRSITTTLSESTARRSITTTLSGFQPEIPVSSVSTTSGAMMTPPSVMTNFTLIAAQPTTYSLVSSGMNSTAVVASTSSLNSANSTSATTMSTVSGVKPYTYSLANGTTVSTSLSTPTDVMPITYSLASGNMTSTMKSSISSLHGIGNYTFSRVTNSSGTIARTITKTASPNLLTSSASAAISTPNSGMSTITVTVTSD